MLCTKEYYCLLLVFFSSIFLLYFLFIQFRENMKHFLPLDMMFLVLCVCNEFRNEFSSFTFLFFVSFYNCTSNEMKIIKNERREMRAICVFVDEDSHKYKYNKNSVKEIKYPCLYKTKRKAK